MYLDCTHKLKLQSNKKANFQDLLMCIFKHSYLKQKNDLLYHSCKLEPISNGYQCSRQYKVITFYPFDFYKGEIVFNRFNFIFFYLIVSLRYNIEIYYSILLISFPI